MKNFEEPCSKGGKNHREKKPASVAQTQPLKKQNNRRGSCLMPALNATRLEGIRFIHKEKEGRRRQPEIEKSAKCHSGGGELVSYKASGYNSVSSDYKNGWPGKRSIRKVN